MPTIKLYANILSQPSRTVLFALKKSGVEHEYENVEIPKGTRSEEFKKNVNPKGLVPVLDVDGEKITESGVIARYVLDSFYKGEDLLPKEDRLARARVEEIIDFSGTTIRPGLIKPQIALVFGPMFLGKDKPGEEESKALLAEIDGIFKTLDSQLEGKTYFYGDKLTIGDVQVYNEILNVSTFLKLDLADFSNLKTWKETVEGDSTIGEINKKFFETLAALHASKESS